ncbi:MAG: urease accessory protein UreD [Rubrobacter sp.]|nr:urease accessory protein UreD [Rubrobacter sp.]
MPNLSHNYNCSNSTEPAAVQTVARAAGQRGELRLGFSRRGERTVLGERRWTAPFGSVRTHYPDGTGTAEVQITNPSGGILGGDRLETHVSLEPGASATLLTQGAGKAYRGPAARQTAAFDLAEGAFLEYLPHHLIPFRGSSLQAETTFSLAAGATLVAWEAYAAGRVARGERFLFDRLSTRTRASREGVPQALDGFDLAGSASSGYEPFGGSSYFGTLLVLASGELTPLAEGLHNALSEIPRTLASASSPAPGVCGVRVLARDAPALYRTLNAARRSVREALDLPAPPREVS